MLKYIKMHNVYEKSRHQNMYLNMPVPHLKDLKHVLGVYKECTMCMINLNMCWKKEQRKMKKPRVNRWKPKKETKKPKKKTQIKGNKEKQKKTYRNPKKQSSVATILGRLRSVALLARPITNGNRWEIVFACVKSRSCTFHLNKVYLTSTLSTSIGMPKRNS